MLSPSEARVLREKEEVERLLGSGIFGRAPNLANLLTYICGKYFAGAADEIKEYNIAVEALGRGPEFDQKRDSIVRVEAHRLRKRLREYYEGPGASNELRLEVPSGQYTPQFVIAPRELLAPPSEPEPETALVPNPELVEATPRSLPAFPNRPRRSRSLWTVFSIGLLLAAIVFAAAVSPWRRAPERPVVSIPTQGPEDDIRILAGAQTGSYVDAFEHTWQGDRYFTGGFVSQNLRIHPVLGTRDQRIYQSRREGGFRYDIPLKPGTYELKLYFAETVYGENNVAGGGETTRVFSVTQNGKSLLDSFDVVGDAGSAVADIKVFKNIQPAPDGKLHLEFSPLSNAAFVNAIELLPSEPNHIRPVRIVARDRGMKDNQNRTWDPDRFAQGGQLVPRLESNVKDSEPELYRSERFGNITYTIPVAENGRYGVNLYFAENWFGQGMPGGGGTGDRLFDILINGVAVRRRFDIYREAGGVNRAATVSLHGVEPSHQGKIVIALTPDRNYSCINALEVVDETR